MGFTKIRYIALLYSSSAVLHLLRKALSCVLLYVLSYSSAEQR